MKRVHNSVGRWYRALSFVLVGGLALISAALAEEVKQAVSEPGDEVRLVHVKDVVMGDSHYWNTVVHSGYNKLMTHGDYQYTVYWNAEFRLTLGRRHLQTDEVATTVFPYTGYPHDVHNVPVLGFSPQDGRLHLAWHMRGAPGLPASNYIVSNSKLISDTPDTMTTNDFQPRVRITSCTATMPRTTLGCESGWFCPARANGLKASGLAARTSTTRSSTRPGGRRTTRVTRATSWPTMASSPSTCPQSSEKTAHSTT